MQEILTRIKPDEPVYNAKDILIAPDFITHEACTELIEYAKVTEAFRAPLGFGEEVGSQEKYANHFVADMIRLKSDPVIKKNSIQLCVNMCKHVMEPRYNMTMEWIEMPHLLHYGPGGTYMSHADAENWDTDKREWVRVSNRDYSMILYLNDDFTGGTLAFPALNIRLHPRTGLLVTFPSTGVFRHRAEEVKTGHRFAFVTWGACIGGPRIVGGDPPNAVKLV